MKKRFESKVEMIPECGCWIWMGAEDRHFGYGMFTIKKYKTEKAHRVSWMLYRGEIPKGLCVLHRCDTPACVNPHHLFLGTKADNNYDMINKKRYRSAKGEKHGSAKLTELQVIEIRKDNRPGGKIAKDYNISAQTIYDIKNKKSWGHVA